MSDASRVQLAYKAETGFSEALPAPEAMTALRFVSENIKHANATVVSEELRADRMRSDLLLVGTDVAGDINFEFSFASFDDWIAASLCGSWAADVLKNGVSLQSFRVQKALLDVGTYFIYQGVCVNGFHLDITARSIVKGVLNLMGAKTVDRATPSQASSILQIPPAGPPYTIITAGPSITSLELNVNMTGIKATALRLDLANNLRPRPDIQSRDSAQFGMGSQDITGSILYYFQNLAVYDIFMANTAQSISFVVKDPISATKKYTFLMPNVKYTDVEVVTPGLEQDIIATATFRALFDTTAACHLQITRVPT